MRNSIFLLLLLLLAIPGCVPTPAESNGENVESTDQEKSGAMVKAKEKYKIAYVTNQQHNFWNIAEVGCMDAQEDLGVEAIVRHPSEATATKQMQIVEDLISSGIDALAISPIDAVNQRETLKKWGSKIPLITHDSDAPGSGRLLFIGVDNYEAGRTVGKLIKGSCPDGAKLIITVGRFEQLNAQLRRQGVIDELLDRESDSTRRDPIDGELSNDKFTIYATLTDQGKPEVAKQKAEDALNTYSELNLFVGLFAYNPPSCLQALRQANLLDKVKIAAFDEDDATLQGIKDGHIIGTVAQNPYGYGYKSIETLTKILNGDKDAIPTSKYIDCPARAVTVDGRTVGGIKTENVDEFWADLKEKTGK